MEQKEDDHGHCLDYVIDYGKHCLPGYVKNENKELPQKCIKGKSTFKIEFKLRFDMLAGKNSEILLGNYFDLESSISLDKIPTKLIDDFIDYRERSTNYSMNSVMNKLIIKDK